MSWTRFFRRRYWDKERARELETYLEIETDENIARGMSPEEARYAAHRKLGNTTLIREEIYRMNSLGWLEILWQYLRFAVRTLRKNPGLTVVATLTLALGIGLNTAIFSMVNALLFRPLPVRHPEEIYTLSAAGTGNAFSYQDFEDIRKQTSSLFSDMAGVEVLSTTGLNVSGKSERMWTEFVTGNFFEMLGIRPALGRFIFPSEGRVAGADPVLVLGYSFWKAHLGADPNIVGKKASVNGRPVTIVGVAPEGFRPLSSFFDEQGYMPLGMAVVDNQTKRDFLNDRQGKRLTLIARLKPGVTESNIRSVLEVVAKRLAAEYPKADHWKGLNAFPLLRLDRLPSPRVDWRWYQHSS